MPDNNLTIAVYMSDSHPPIFVEGSTNELRLLTMRIKMSWELNGPIPSTTQTLASHALAIGGVMVNPKHITRVAFVNEAREPVAAPVGFTLP